MPRIEYLQSPPPLQMPRPAALFLPSSEAVGLQCQLNWLAAYTACSVSIVLRFGGLQLAGPERLLCTI